jgi:hypothetical protein
METSKCIYRVNRRQINYLKVTIESYDGMAVLRTLDPSVALVEILVAPGCENLVLSILECLDMEESLSLSPVEIPV